MFGAIAGLGITAFFFYRTLEQGAKTEIQDNLNTRVKEVDSQLRQGEQFLLGMANTTQFLHLNKAGSVDAYKRLVISAMAVRPQLVTGFGVMQTPKGLIADRTWFGPYIVQYNAKVIEQIQQGQPAERLSSPYQNFAYQEISITDKYFQEDYYTDAVKVGKNYWIDEPYTTEDYPVPLTTFAGPIRDAQGKLVAVFNGDISLEDLIATLKDQPAFQKAGYYVLLTPQGSLLAYPLDPQKATDLQNVKAVPKLNTVWSQVQRGLSKNRTGIFASGATASYWAYQTIPSTKWVMLATVPYGAVSGSALLITAGGVALAAVILAGVVVLFSNQLNRRFQPILDECNKLAATDAETQKVMRQQDEIGRLSTSFFNLLGQVTANEQQLRQEVTRTQQAQEQLQQQAKQIEADSQALQSDVSELLEAVSAVEDGDLTVQAPVSDRVTGLVSDTLNRLIERLTEVLSQVASTAQQVTQTSQATDASARAVASNAQQQAQEIARVLSLTEQVQVSAQDSANQINLANLTLNQVQTTVEEGQDAIQTLVAGIQTLQSGTNRIVQRTQDLDTFVNLTEQFAAEQGQLASLIQSLAMSATLLSARATAQQDPRQMMVVAKEFETIATQIKGLAEQTNQNLSSLQKRTDQIRGTVSSVNQDLQGIDRLVGGFTKGVEQSSQAFGSIQAATTEVVKTEETVAQASQQIVQTAQSTATAMQGIAQLADQTAQLTQTARSQSERMGQISQQLLQRIQFFRLPESATRRIDLSQSEEGTVDVSPAATS
jgi:twitching motility protein PilJ